MAETESPDHLSFLDGGGEMGKLIRGYDWTSTPLGSPLGWPQSLRTIVGVLLTSKFPMYLWWGPQLIQLYNDAYRPSFGQTGKHPDVLGKPGAEWWPEAWGTLKPLIQQVQQSRQATWHQDQLIPNLRNGQLEDVYWTFSFSPVMDESNQVGGVLVIVLETTQQIQNARYLQQRTLELEQRTAELALANEELGRSNANLELFASAASHDMQEPLRKIQSFGLMLRRTYGSLLGQEGSDLVARMELAATRMSQLVRDLLTYSRLSTHTEPLRIQALNPIVEEVINELDQLIQEKSAQVEVASLGTIQGDSTQLGQLFRNLLSNALKFVNPLVKTHIRIESQTLTRSDLPPTYQPPDDHEQFCVLRIIDNGIGFEQAQAERIFETFQRLHGRHHYPGSGLGLAIVKRVVENHQGYVMAQSQPGQGATFTIYLPTG
ncbi:PAS domain-containing sensor histidine kinase [Spirosoma horti]